MALIWMRVFVPLAMVSGCQNSFSLKCGENLLTTLSCGASVAFEIISHLILSQLVHISCRRVISFECCLIIMAYPYYVYNLSQAWRDATTLPCFSSPRSVHDSFQIHKTFAIYLLCIVTPSWKWEKSTRKKEIEYTRELAVHEHILSNQIKLKKVIQLSGSERMAEIMRPESAWLVRRFKTNANILVFLR